MRWRDRIFGRTLAKEHEQAGRDLIAVVNGNEIIDNMEQAVVDLNREVLMPTRRTRYRFARTLAAKAKEEFPGMQENTKSNRLVVHRYIRDRMREHKMRLSHIDTMLPIAVSIFFIPTEAEIEARRLDASSAVLDQVEDGTRKLQTRQHADLFNWFGSARKRPEPTDA